MLNLLWVKTLLTVVENRSFQVAADRLRIAQPTVSQHVRKLETQLGVRLIRRSRVGAEPTDAAIAFLPHAHSLMRVNDRAMVALRGHHLRLGASSNIGIYMLPPHVRSFLQDRDPATFDLVIDRNPAIAHKIENGEIDIAVMEWWNQHADFQAQVWRKEPVVLIVPPLHPFARRTGIGRGDLIGVELLGGEPGTGTGRLLGDYFGALAAVPRVSLQLGSTEAVKQAVKAGIGISLVLELAVADEVRTGSLRAIPLVDPPLHKDLFVIWHGGGGPEMPTFVRHIVDNGRV